MISQLLVFFNLLGFAFLLINSETKIAKNLTLLLAIAITAAYTFFTVWEWISQKPLPDFWHRSIFAICAAAWLKESYWWLSIVLLFFILLDVLAHRKLVVEITEKKITATYIFQKRMKWEEVDNVILKDGLLTIDLKNNILFQHLILNSDDDVNEDKFNEFCRQQLKKSEFYSDH